MSENNKGAFESGKRDALSEYGVSPKPAPGVGFQERPVPPKRLGTKLPEARP